METSELLLALNARGLLLLARNTGTDDPATDMGLALLALERLLTLATTVPAATNPHPEVFKAKSNRW